MQTSLARRQARRMNGSRHRRGSGGGRKALVAVPLFLFGTMAVVALVGFIGVVGVFAAYSRDLSDPRELETYVPIQESVVYDRTGQVELARFSAGERREVVAYADIPPILIDATTSIEDRSFWTNTGFDPVGILSAAIDTLRGRERGASTITQQLVRQRLLDPELVRDPDRRIERKIKEIIQSTRVTEAYPGVEGKQRIITAYLNQNYYGNGSYGIKAAARSYFGVEDLADLTLGQAALLAALPQSPSSYDLVRNAVEDEDGELYVPLDPENIQIVARRNYVLELMASDPDRLVLTGDEYSAEELLAARDEEIRLVRQTAPRWQAPHFVWSVRQELAERLCADAETCPVLERGGLRITTTLDMAVQASAEKWVTAGMIVPHETNPAAAAARLGVEYSRWMRKLSEFEVSNGALVALDYQTREIVAYVGSAGYYRNDLASAKFQPQFDVLGNGWRQPGSAFKPFNYVTGIDDRTMTAATMFMDVTTRFPDGGNGQPYTPKNADLLERGPLRLRSALQFSLNIPAVKAVARNGVQRVFDKAKEFGFEFQNPNRPSAGLSLTLGTEVVHWLDLANAYGTLANGGRHLPPTRILRITDSAGLDLIPSYQPPVGTPVVTPQAAFIVSDILAGNTNPDVNPFWGEFNIPDAAGSRRPAAFKTGTNNDAKDLTAAGFIPPPTAEGRAAGQYALVAAVWAGNSDGSVVATPDNPVFSIDVTAPLWQAFMTDVSRTWPITQFERPGGLVEADVDAWSGGRPTQWTTQTVRELFIDGTVPGDDPIHRPLQVLVDAEENVYLFREGCPGLPETRGFLDFSTVEADQPDWRPWIDDWVDRARRGPGVEGGPDPDVKTATSYFYNSGYTPYGKSWGAPFPPTADCTTAPTPTPVLSLCPLPTELPIGTAPGVCPSPSPSPSESPSPSPSELPTESPTTEPTEEPTEEPTIVPTLPPTPSLPPTPTLPLPTPTQAPTPTQPPEPTPTPT